ncbi:F-box/LRR-repeat protein At5g02910 [Lactuca sativa]|uniref:At1g61320/AtMIF1 LRR domain-containing protein n=1 Tax=Lactuca sativa TaxID=4236 RepID=A0A9R1VP09_LACSA|nr:F-box/LRR-repeat protein At5g02910 [Lactuca sativa]KAJ0209840.1 hypothetical protein LSAT_V11C400208660 [Lactuca sativa]
MRREVEDVVELMHRIQARLAVKEAARTSVLSKSWLHAWSTIPTLRFYVGRGKSMKLVDVDHTLIRYLRDNIPIESFELKMDMQNQESASHAEKWIGFVATKTSLKEFSLSVYLKGASSFTLPDELLLGENLTKIRVGASWGTDISVRMTTSHHPVIKCVSLRELHLAGVHISEEALNDILSSCSSLEKIRLSNIDFDSCEGFKTIKVINLPRLYELSITLDAALEISNVPNLAVFSYDLLRSGQLRFSANVHSLSLSNVTQLMLGGVVRDNVCLDMIKSRFPFLESLTLDMKSWMLGSFHFTCASIKILSLTSHKKLFDVQVCAPKLLFFSFSGDSILPNLLFPVSSLRQIKLSLSLDLPLDASFFLKLREALMLSRKCDLCISITNNSDSSMPLDIDIDELRRRLLFPPAMNVQELEFETDEDECLWERSPFFDAFFEICHPKHIYARPDRHYRHNNHFCRLMLREVLEKKKTTAIWPHRLQHVLIRPLPHKKWRTLTNSQRTFLQASTPVDFKLKWR